MTYVWCSAISKKLGELDQGKPALARRLSPHRIGSHHSQDESADKYTALLLTALQIGFRQPKPSYLFLAHTSHHHWMFDIVFSSDDDEVIADAVCAWVVDRDQATFGSCARRLAKRAERAVPFPHRLRRTIVGAVEGSKPRADGSELDSARLLNRLDLDVDDVEDRDRWQQLLVDVIRSPMGRVALSSRNWCLLGELTLAGDPRLSELRDVDVEVLRLLDNTEDWEKLEVWVLVIWSSFDLEPEVSMEVIKRVTLRLLQRRPSALQRWESLYERGRRIQGDQLWKICNQVRAEQLPSASL
jgi:hypothetical protein